MATKSKTLLAILFLAGLPIPALGQSSPISAPLSRSEILGLLAIGESPSLIAYRIGISGLTFASNGEFLSAVERAGGRGILISKLSDAKPGNLTASIADSDHSFDHLAECAELLHIGNVENALPECRAAIDENPKSPWPLLTTEHALSYANLPGEECAELARRALALNPNSPSLENESYDMVLANYFYVGVPSGDPGFVDPPNAEVPIGPQIRRLLESEPDVASTHLFVARRFEIAGDFEKSRRELKEAVRLEPDNPRLHSEIARSYEDRGNLEAAFAEFREAVRIAPYDVQQRVTFAQALQNHDRTDEAIRELRDLLALVPDSATAKNDLAWIYVTTSDSDSRNPGEALSLAYEAVQATQATNPHFLDTLAEALLINGQPEEALKIEQQALDLNPDDEQMQSRLERFQEAAQNDNP